ncbi:MAG: Gfo/Idh/MocA family oxidoreductase [Acidimicrobiales bacterium]|nr:Gfo/Idh/MocA family oxidoreductase [Acidimicrobiales bacterium]
MIAERQFDFAVVCSPPHMHVEQLRLLLDAGIPTLCEKPLALSATDARTVEKPQLTGTEWYGKGRAG